MIDAKNAKPTLNRSFSNERDGVETVLRLPPVSRSPLRAFTASYAPEALYAQRVMSGRDELCYSAARYSSYIFSFAE